MAMLDARTWLEILPADECWRLLRLGAVGRLAVVVAGAPDIYPVNYAADGESIVFRTDPGTKLAALVADGIVAFEVDGLDLDARTGWSVVARGPVVELAGAELAAAGALPLVPWAIGDKQRWFRIRPTAVSGRSIHARSARR